MARQVSHAGLASLPAEVANLANLTSLVLKGNQVGVIVTVWSFDDH